MKLNDEEVTKLLKNLSGWEMRGDKIYRAFRFNDFVEAFGFMASCALIAEAIGHHPEWSNVYNRVEIYLTTHDVGGLSALDFEFARRMEALLSPTKMETGVA